MDNNESFVTNCLIRPRRSSLMPLFEYSPDKIIVRLDSYAIIPIEEYNKLKEKNDKKQ